jgi:hypothetical protein
MCALDWRPVVAALAALLVAASPGVAALLQARANSATIHALPVKRSSDVVTPATLRQEIERVLAANPATGGGAGGSTSG